MKCMLQGLRQSNSAARRMLPLKVTVLFFVAALFCSCKGLPGTWVMESKNTSGNGSIAITFNEDGSFALKTFMLDVQPTSAGIPVGNQYIPGTGKWRLTNTGRYEVDDAKNPHWLDLLVQRQGGMQRVEMIYNMPSEDVLQLGTGYTNARPESFDRCREYYPMRRATAEEAQRINQQ